MRNSSTELLARSHYFDTKPSLNDKNTDLEKGWKDRRGLIDSQKNKRGSNEMEMMSTEQDQEGFASQPLQSSVLIGAGKSSRKESERTQTLSSSVVVDFILKGDSKKSRHTQKDKVLIETLKRGIDSQGVNLENSSKADKMHDTLEYLASPRSEKFLSTDFTKEETPRILLPRLGANQKKEGESSEAKSRKESMDSFLTKFIKDSAPSSPTTKVSQNGNSGSECEICFEFNIQSAKDPVLPCGHKFCIECYQSYLEQKISFDTVLDIRCPKDGCREKFSDNHIEAVLDEKLFQRYKKFKKVASLNLKQNLRWCSRRGCQRYIIGKRGIEKVTCECGTDTCFKCGSQYHPGKSCEAVVDVAYKKYAQENNIHTCPYCRCNIEKFDGCNHITCPMCAYEWCWLCGKQYTPTHYSISNPAACSKLPRINKAEYARPTLKTYIGRAFEGIFMFIFMPLMLLILAINMPTWHYEKYLEKKYGAKRDLQPNDDCFFRTVLIFFGLVLCPISLIYVIVVRAVLMAKTLHKWVLNRKNDEDQFDKKIQISVS